MSTLSPAEQVAQNRKVAEEEKAARSYKFPESKRADGEYVVYGAKTNKIDDTITAKSKTVFWEVTAITKEVRPDGKKVEIKLNYWKVGRKKEDGTMTNPLARVWEDLTKAGADLSALPSRIEDPIKHDAMINKCMEHLMDINAKFTFTCSHSVRKAVPGHINAGMRKEGLNIGFWIQEFEKVDGKLPLEGILDAAEAPKAKKVPVKETEPEKLEEEAATNNAFDDDGDE